MVEHNRQVMLRTNSHVPPGARPHLLAVGISAYNQDYAKSLRLHYADRDANANLMGSCCRSDDRGRWPRKGAVIFAATGAQSGYFRSLTVTTAQ